MNFNVKGIAKKLVNTATILGLAVSCVNINTELGKEFIPTRHQYDVYTVEFNLKDLKFAQTDSLSGYSSQRITIGAVKDPVYGLTTRSSAFTLIPVTKNLDFGKNTKFRQFHFSAVADTTSIPEDNQKKILQNINVFTLSEEIGENDVYTSSGDKLKIGERVSNGIPIYSGGDSLSFDFTDEFGKKYIETLKEMELDSVSNYVKKLPGIYLSVDEPISYGGRINMFELPVKVSDYYITGNYAELKFTADYGDRHQVDTSFLFFFGAQDMTVYQPTTSIYAKPTLTPQFALNVTSSEMKEGKAKDKIFIEGGGGVKPVVSSKEIKDSCIAIFNSLGLDPKAVIVNKASIILPFEYEDYKKLALFPARLSPTCRIRSTDEKTSQKIVSFAGLTDASVQTENQGDIDRSNLRYAPDVSHHVQEILRRGKDENYENFDIWFLIMSKEVIQTSNDNQMSDYSNNLNYYNYYNSLYDPYYGGGYGYGYGYGGYDSYYGYNNYYNYMMAAQYASTQSTQTTSNIQLDKDRYYSATLKGPEPNDPEDKRVPKVKLTFSISKTAARK